MAVQHHLIERHRFVGHIVFGALVGQLEQNIRTRKGICVAANGGNAYTGIGKLFVHLSVHLLHHIAVVGGAHMVIGRKHLTDAAKGYAADIILCKVLYKAVRHGIHLLRTGYKRLMHISAALHLIVLIIYRIGAGQHTGCVQILHVVVKELVGIYLYDLTFRVQLYAVCLSILLKLAVAVPAAQLAQRAHGAVCLVHKSVIGPAAIAKVNTLYPGCAQLFKYFARFLIGGKGIQVVVLNTHNCAGIRHCAEELKVEIYILCLQLFGIQHSFVYKV